MWSVLETLMKMFKSTMHMSFGVLYIYTSECYTYTTQYYCTPDCSKGRKKPSKNTLANGAPLGGGSLLNCVRPMMASAAGCVPGGNPCWVHLAKLNPKPETRNPC